MENNADNVVINEYIKTYGTDRINHLAADEIDHIAEFTEKSIKRHKLKISEMDAVWGYFRNLMEEESFQSFHDRVIEDLIPYFDLEIFRLLSIDEQKTILQHVFYQHVFSYNSIDMKIPEDKRENVIIPCRKVFNTIIKTVIGYNASREFSIYELVDKFGFANEISTYIVDLIMTNKTEMREIYKLRMMTNIEERLSVLGDSMNTFFQLFDDSKEEDSES